MGTLVDLKQTDCQLFLQQRWVYSGSIENCSLWSAIMVSHAQVPQTARERECFYRKEKGVGRAIINKVPMLLIGWVLARKVLPYCWALMSQGMRAFPSGIPTLFNWGFCILIFYTLLNIYNYQGSPLSSSTHVTLYFHMQIPQPGLAIPAFFTPTFCSIIPRSCGLCIGTKKQCVGKCTGV